MLNEVYIRKNATRKINRILEIGREFFEWERCISLGGSDRDSFVTDIINRAEFDVWFKKRYSVIKITLFFIEQEMVMAIFKGFGECDRVIIKFKLDVEWLHRLV